MALLSRFFFNLHVDLHFLELILVSADNGWLLLLRVRDFICSELETRFLADFLKLWVSVKDLLLHLYGTFKECTCRAVRDILHELPLIIFSLTQCVSPLGELFEIFAILLAAFQSFNLFHGLSNGCFGSFSSVRDILAIQVHVSLGDVPAESIAVSDRAFNSSLDYGVLQFLESLRIRDVFRRDSVGANVLKHPNLVDETEE